MQILFAIKSVLWHLVSMGSLTSLKARVADLLEEEPKAINSRSLFLTKAGLLTSEGRGRTAMARPSDATNLLLAFLGGGQATGVVSTVRSLRAARGTHPGPDRKKLPPIDCLQSLPFFPFEDQSARVVRARGKYFWLLGDMLDAMLADWSKREGRRIPFNDVDEYVCIDFGIRRSRHAWSASISLTDDEDTREWGFSFEAPNCLASDIDFLENGDRVIRESVGDRTFSQLAKELRLA